MRVRVFDKDSNTYFVSEVYAIINSRKYTKYLVVQKIDGEKYFKLIDLYNTNVSSPHAFNIVIISENNPSEPWTIEKDDSLVYFKSRIPANNSNKGLYCFFGYKFIFEQKEFLIDLYYGNSIRYETLMKNKVEVTSKLKDWSYIENNEDIEYLMDSFIDFHDSVLVSLSYISGSKHVEGGMCVTNSLRQVSMIFDGYSKVINGNRVTVELVFDSVTLFNLIPAGNNQSSFLQHAVLTYDNGTITFFDYISNRKPEDYDSFLIKAYELRWRIFNTDEQ